MIENLIIASEHLAGFVIVILALCILWTMTALLGRIFAPGAASSAKPSKVSEAESRDSDESDWIDNDEVVAVCAAVATMLDERHRIVSLRSQTSGWGRQGRAEIHASHRIR